MTMFKKAKILFEAGPMLDSKKTGVGYYVEGIVHSLAESYGEQVNLLGYYFNFLHRNPDKVRSDANVSYREIKFTPGKLLSLCRRLHFQPFLEIFIRENAEIVWFTNYVSLPMIKKQRNVLTVYDTSFLDVPEFTQEVNLAYLKRFCPPSIERADLIITISEFTKGRLQALFPNLQAPIIVTPIPPQPVSTASGELPDRLTSLGVQPKSYILYLGTIEPRKNLIKLIEAYHTLQDEVKSQYALVLAGGKGWKDEAILAAVAGHKDLGDSIILTDYVSEIEKHALYANASCFVLPSHYEGFGMPILEAMQYGIPTAVSNLPVFHEVASDGVLYFDKESVRSISGTLQKILSNPVIQAELIQVGFRRVRSYSWKQNADKVYAAFNELLR
jgi:glycosyltransferase involved in cell wall biosynthesis